MKIIQVLPSLAFGDAIGNHVLALKELFQNMGYDTEIYAEAIDQRLPEKTAYQIQELPNLNKTDILLYHLSTGTRLNKLIASAECRKIVQYHNITPPYFFGGYNFKMKRNAEWGLNGAKYLADKVDYVWAVSEFNKNDLRTMGYQQEIDIAPILIPFEDYNKKPSEKIMELYNDGAVNLLFTGRIAPNKRQEDVIKAFFYYKNYINPNSRLFLVGNYTGLERYYEKLQEYVQVLNLTDVYFTGHIPFDEILAYYRIANGFICMSEHEGFCVPLVEAMYFGVPILAYASSAVPETLKTAGILLKEKEPKLAAEWIDRIITDSLLVTYLKTQQKKRLEGLGYKAVSQIYRGYITRFIEEMK